MTGDDQRDPREMLRPVRCAHCGRVYDLGRVETIARYADCTLYKTPCCGRTVDDRPWPPAFREVDPGAAATNRHVEMIRWPS
jgi:hypothetical protein